ncbi:mitogen-activated protein kinase kinase kinase 5 [Gastrolobium bilobum]|uniref:mitogen-activated protein kinase kinase kinase 5 n=1 Tax=Gastrolobium bilobum TaxID=150636 RepID=UPI002AB19511|nr:mitogen-activated protein kinase kinase kinase 5 [Gastrolobium bilobum]
MRWLPTLSFSPSHSSSSSSSSSSATVDHRRKVWLFGNSSDKKRTRHVGDHDARGHFSDEDALVPSPHSSVEPHPLPLPEFSSAALLRHRDGDSRLPSPTGFRMRSVFASPDTRKNMEQAETRSSRLVHQDLGGSENTRDCVQVRSASSSPFASPSISPQRKRNGDFVPYYYVTPGGKQCWSAPEMSTSEAGLPPPAFFDLSTLGTNASPPPHQSPQVRGPQGHLRSSSGPPSTIHTLLSLEISTARRESNAPVSVHPLPLPPGAALPSPSAAATLSHAVALPMKSQWKKGKLIGRGTFGSVYVATNRETGALCAMKEVELYPDDPKSAECMKQLQQEIKVFSHLKHTNIVQYYGCEIVEDRFYIYLEYVHPGSINKYVHEHCGAITESVIRNFTRHILSGLAYLHSKKTIHRDIKGANLLVDSAGVVKLADFGMAKHLTGYEANLSLKGSPYWMAPELLQAVMQKDNSSDLAFAIDIWSLGCTIIEMFTGKPPWSEYEGAAAMFKVMRDTPPIPETLSSEGKDFLRCCFKRNPAERPSAAVLLEHRFLKNSQQPDVLSPTQQYNGTSFMDKPHSPRGQSENKSDQMFIPSAKIANGKAAVRRGFLVPSLDILPEYWDQ